MSIAIYVLLYTFLLFVFKPDGSCLYIPILALPLFPIQLKCSVNVYALCLEFHYFWNIKYFNIQPNVGARYGSLLFDVC